MRYNIERLFFLWLWKAADGKRGFAFSKDAAKRQANRYIASRPPAAPVSR